MLTKESLMRDRYMLLQSYPGCLLEECDIVEKSANFYICGNIALNEDAVEPFYPGVYTKLKWWQHRRISELPEYINLKGVIWKVICWKNNLGDCRPKVEKNPRSIENFMIEWHLHKDNSLPATEEDYNEQQNLPKGFVVSE